jgi:hypothetical protein
MSMSDLLAIVDSDSTPEELVAEIIRRHPDRVTLLVEDCGPDCPEDETTRGLLAERLTVLRAAIEAGTGAVVVGLANSRDQLRGWRFDRTVGGRQTRAVL